MKTKAESTLTFNNVVTAYYDANRTGLYGNGEVCTIEQCERAEELGSRMNTDPPVNFDPNAADNLSFETSHGTALSPRKREEWNRLWRERNSMTPLGSVCLSSVQQIGEFELFNSGQEFPTPDFPPYKPFVPFTGDHFLFPKQT